LQATGAHTQCSLFYDIEKKIKEENERNFFGIMEKRENSNARYEGEILSHDAMPFVGDDFFFFWCLMGGILNWEPEKF
jgi:hypothetical protein